MTYTSLYYFVLLISVFVAYYIVPSRHRWIVLLGGSAIFIYFAGGIWSVLFIYFSAIVTYFAGLLFQTKKTYKGFLVASVIVVVFLTFRYANYLYMNLVNSSGRIITIAAPIGLSFYTLSLIGYMIDVYHGCVVAEKNALKFCLFVSFFPHILQGPIARYDQLSSQLYNNTKLEYERVTRATQLILWGIIKKLVIADRLGIFVDTIYAGFHQYGFVEIFMAVVFYGVQLYADFSGCVDISRGTAELFGIRLINNFQEPYFARSVSEFWRRWHISLSSWLKDYIYIPLGGNRMGVARKYVNILIVFIVSGLWHGTGITFLFWGLLHGVYQVLEGVFHLKSDKPICVIRTFLLVDFAWLFFRAENMTSAFQMIERALKHVNLWAFFDGSLYNCGLDAKNLGLAIIGILVLGMVDYWHKNGIAIRDVLAKQHIAIRWFVYMMAIFVALIFGEYGYGYNAADFIYMQF